MTLAEPDGGTCDEQPKVRMLVGVVHATCHNPNTPPPASPLVNGPVIRLPGQHRKVRDSYRATET